VVVVVVVVVVIVIVVAVVVKVRVQRFRGGDHSQRSTSMYLLRVTSNNGVKSLSSVRVTMGRAPSLTRPKKANHSKGREIL